MSTEQILAVGTSLIPSFAQDVIGVYTSNFLQVFPGARPMRVEVKRILRPAEHPLETGAVTTDHVIFEPIDITLYVILPSPDYRNTYESIVQFYQAAELLIVKTKGATFNNMLISEIPHVEDSEHFNALTMILKLRQTLFVTSEFQEVPADPQNTPTVSKGTVNGQPLPDNSLPTSSAKTLFGGLL